MEDKSKKVTIVVNLQPSKTSYEQIKDGISNFVTNIILFGFVFIVIVSIIAMCAS